MARTLKKTRIKNLPPKVQLRNRDAASGSYPAHLRLASDNRSGNFRTFFDDTKTIIFTNYDRISGSFTGGQNIGPGFDVLGTYDNYALGPSILSGGNVVLWWRFEAVQSDNSGGLGYADDGGGRHPVTQETNGFSLSTDVPSYYNNERETFDNHYSLYISGAKSTDPPVSDRYSAYQSDHNFSTSSLTGLPFTLAAHVKFDSVTGQTYNPILWRGDVASQSPDWELFVSSSQAIIFGVFESSTGDRDIYTTATGVLSASTWQHVAVTFDGVGGCKFYLNGTALSTSLLSSTGWPGFVDTDNNPVYLGKARDQYLMGGDYYSQAKFDGVVIANRVATAAEVQYLYSGSPIPGDATIANTEVGAVGVSMPSGLHSQSPFLKRYDATGSLVANEELQSSIVVTAAVRKGIGDSFATFTPGQDLTPFRDDWHPAVDAISVSGSATQSTFYATGSRIGDIGEGFDQPLWSKSKIEIDLTPATTCSFSIINNTSASNNYPMGYWNHSSKIWQGVGLGREFGYYYTSSLLAVNQFFDQQCIGFTTGLDNGGASVRDFSIGAVTSNFGFPYHPKFHATSSNTINVSDYISEPFLLEKVVLEFSGALSLGNTSVSGSTKMSMTTFFILNQRKPFAYQSSNVQAIPFITTSVGNTAVMPATGVVIPSNYRSEYVNTIRDLVGWWQIVSFRDTDSTTLERLGRDYNIVSSASNPEWSGRFSLSGSAKNALPSSGHAEVILQSPVQYMTINQNSTRSGLFTPSGRDYIGALEKGQELDSTFLNFGNVPVVTLSRYSKTNPYLLMPGDQLILGWQLPYHFVMNDAGGDTTYNGVGPKLEFAASPAKIILYGSLIRENREFHDTLNQHLTSVSVHEVIE